MILVRHILEDARKRLAVLQREALVCEAAGILADPAKPLVVVSDAAGISVGVITKSNIIAALARANGNAVKLTVGTVMTDAFLSCHIDQELKRVWDSMSERSVRSVPVLDDSGRPQGVIHARDIAHALLDEVDEEELLLRDYVLGIGYQ